jgi:hypothetical protein
MRRTFDSVLRHRLAVGLFLLRLVVVAVAISSRGGSASNFVEQGSALLLLGGIWTSAVGGMITLVEVWRLVSGSGGWVSVLVATITTALALMGPGPWSVDAQLLGWRRIEIPTRERCGNSRLG